MTLAAVLELEGFSYTDLELLDDRHCLWVFEQTQELMDLIEAFEDREVQVDPREFLSVVSHVRNRMYEFLKHDAPRVGAEPTVART